MFSVYLLSLRENTGMRTNSISTENMSWKSSWINAIEHTSIKDFDFNKDRQNIWKSVTFSFYKYFNKL